MPGRRPKRARAVSSLSVVQAEDESTNRALAQVGDAVQKLQAKRDRDAKTVDLLVGTNKVRHGLGRPVLGYTITPTYLTIAFGHALNTGNPHPELEVWIDVVGSDQEKARVEIF
jgi:hypothetical protein